uniref:Zinc finger protein 292-like n=1 Tax=Sinocyclocheilus grahami TaxID=75366 RepID=A0A672NA81_SINGR
MLFLSEFLKKKPRNMIVSSNYLCCTLVEYASLWRIEEEPLPVLEVYIIALLSFAQASPHLSTQCEAVPVLLERLSLSCAELLLSLPRNIPDALWDRFRSSVQIAHPLVQEKRISNLMILSTIAREQGVWSNPTLQGILTNHMPPQEKGAARYPQSFLRTYKVTFLSSSNMT